MLEKCSIIIIGFMTEAEDIEEEKSLVRLFLSRRIRISSGCSWRR